WSGKAFAWLIVALTFVVSIEVFKRYILNAPTAWIFDLDNMLYGTLFMMCGAYTLAAAGHVRADFVYIYMRPRGQAALDLALYLLFFIPGILGLIYAGYDYAALSWRIGEHSTVTAEGPGWKGRRRATRPPATGAWWSTRTRERPLPRPDDAGAHRGRDHDGLPDRVHADGPGDGLRLHRVLGPGPALVRQPDLRPDRAADVRRDDERHAAVDPAVRVHGLHHGAGGAGRPDVPQRPARVPARPGVAGGDDPAGVRILGDRFRHRRRRRRPHGRHRDAPDAERGL